MNAWTGSVTEQSRQGQVKYGGGGAPTARAYVRYRQDTATCFIIYFSSIADGADHRDPTVVSSRFSEARRPAPPGRRQKESSSHRPASCTPDSPTGVVSAEHLVVVRRVSRTMPLNTHELSRQSCNGTQVGPAARCSHARAERSSGGRRTNSSRQSTRRTTRRR
jgi:hypothetical protein